MAVNFGMVTQKTKEDASWHEGQSTVSQRLDRGGPWESVNHGEFANDRAWAKDRENPFCALNRSYAHFEYAFFEPKAAIAICPSLEEDLSSFKRCRGRPCQ
jgi:hypothetical protein